MFESVIPLLRVKDSQRSQQFFEHLGFKPLWEHQDPGAPRFVELHLSGVSVFLSEHNGDGPFGIQLYFVVQDVESLYKRALEGEFNCTVEPYDAEWGHRVFVLEDLDGNRLSFGSKLSTG